MDKQPTSTGDRQSYKSYITNHINHADSVRLLPIHHHSSQTIATSHDLTRKVAFRQGTFSYFREILVIIWPDHWW